MANSRFGYVRQAELDDRLLPNTFSVIRLDGKGFTKFSQAYGFEKPNDLRALNLMNRAAIQVLESDLGRGYISKKSEKKSKLVKQEKSSTGIILAYGQSDEFSFAFGRNCQAYNRRSSKLLTTVLSTFTAAYIHLWSEYFPQTPLSIDHLPSFDGRIIQYATFQELQDYFKWRQVDAHINNLYNTTFWALVQQGNRTTQEAHNELKGSFSKDKHSILFDRFQINYNNELEIFKKGSILIWSSSHKINDVNQTSADLEALTITTRNVEEVSNNIPKSSTSLTQSSADPYPENRPIESVDSVNDDDLVNSVSVVHQDLVKDHWWITGPGSRFNE
ncbi:hypothetical protein PSTG_11622 [Puccinia striiformis f. sp. tritici PST-78]|uniref:tRNA(His) guanylyltransferase n=1 Tax=Puccinia striiformis f. sp. tritici PST-78 TaxID=1165861 RepID=A0A0L0V6V0_9BASI|nr:hypothetical protein PSTG_11622 [Puccinia striiformis f. sp. tritici PST-78]